MADESTCRLLLDLELIDAMPDRFVDNTVRISQLADEYIRTRGTGHEESTLVLYRKAKTNLTDCFGDVDIKTLAMSHGREFWRWLHETKGLGSNTAKQRLRYARAFFAMAIEDRMIEVNPFKAGGLSVVQSAAEKEYIPRSVVEKAIDHCPTLEWKVLFALVRSIPTRVPTEIRELTWNDIDWENNTILIHSPKTRKIGKSARLVPLFATLKPWLEQAYFGYAQNGDPYVFPTLRKMTNVAKMAGDILTKAKLRVWPKFFNALRASTETDLMDQYGLRRACQWAGNSPTTAMKNYALVRKTDYIDVGAEPQKVDAKSDAKIDSDAKSDAVPASVIETGETNSAENKALERMDSLNKESPMGVTGLEPVTSTMSTWRSSQLS